MSHLPGMGVMRTLLVIINPALMEELPYWKAVTQGCDMGKYNINEGIELGQPGS